MGYAWTEPYEFVSQLYLQYLHCPTIPYPTLHYPTLPTLHYFTLSYPRLPYANTLCVHEKMSPRNERSLFLHETTTSFFEGCFFQFAYTKNDANFNIPRKRYRFCNISRNSKKKNSKYKGFSGFKGDHKCRCVGNLEERRW